MGNRAAEQYLLRVKRGLVCGRADRDYLFARFRQLADGFQEELPEAGYAEFVAAFGRPEEHFGNPDCNAGVCFGFLVLKVCARVPVK